MNWRAFKAHTTSTSQLVLSTAEQSQAVDDIFVQVFRYLRIPRAALAQKLNFPMCLDYLLIRRVDGHISNPFALRINGMSLRELDNSFAI